jgi:hypothetical protein
MIKLVNIIRVYLAVLVILPASGTIAQSAPGLFGDHRLIMEVIVDGQPNHGGGSLYPRSENDLRDQLDGPSVD